VAYLALLSVLNSTLMASGGSCSFLRASPGHNSCESGFNLEHYAVHERGLTKYCALCTLQVGFTMPMHAAQLHKHVHCVHGPCVLKAR
jgi:hypothetical protein